MATRLNFRYRYRILEVVHVEHGHWCRRCALPSAAKIWLASQAVINGRLGPLRLSIGYRCEDCHTWRCVDVDH